MATLVRIQSPFNRADEAVIRRIQFEDLQTVCAPVRLEAGRQVRTSPAAVMNVGAMDRSRAAGHGGNNNPLPPAPAA